MSSGEVSFNRIKKTRECVTEAGVANSSVLIYTLGHGLGLGMIGEGNDQRPGIDLGHSGRQQSEFGSDQGLWESGLPPEYVFYYLWGQYDSTRRIGSGNNQPALNKSRVQLITLPVPPLAEQHRIVAEVERHLSVIQNAEAVVDTSLKRAERLRQSILKQAFLRAARSSGSRTTNRRRYCWSASAPSVPRQRPRQKLNASQGRRRSKSTPARQLSLSEQTP